MSALGPVAVAASACWQPCVLSTWSASMFSATVRLAQAGGCSEPPALSPVLFWLGVLAAIPRAILDPFLSAVMLTCVSAMCLCEARLPTSSCSYVQLCLLLLVSLIPPQRAKALALCPVWFACALCLQRVQCPAHTHLMQDSSNSGRRQPADSHEHGSGPARASACAGSTWGQGALSTPMHGVYTARPSRGSSTYACPSNGMPTYWTGCCGDGGYCCS